MQEQQERRQRAGPLLEWTSANKTFFILLVTGLIYLAYAVWGRVILDHPATTGLIDQQGLAVTLT